MSDGYRSIIGLVADIASRCIKLNPHLGKNAIKKTPGIVLIDELDLHLHPNWQKRIVADLKNTFPKIQFVVTTHSPFIVQSLNTEELVILDDNIQKDGNPSMKSIEDIAEEEMGVEEVRRSEKFQEMEAIAAKYFDLIAKGKTSEEDVETRRLKEQLDEMQEQFSNDPAYVALLKAERKSKGL